MNSKYLVIHDFAWWSDNAIAFSHVDGQVGIFTISGTNILGKQEKFENLPMLTDTVGKLDCIEDSSFIDGKFFVLSHKEHAVRMPKLADSVIPVFEIV